MLTTSWFVQLLNIATGRDLLPWCSFCPEAILVKGGGVTSR